MLPAFGAPESKVLLPLFTRSAEAVSMKWKDMLLTAPVHAQEINIPLWISRAAMNAIGEGTMLYNRLKKILVFIFTSQLLSTIGSMPLKTARATWFADIIISCKICLFYERRFTS